MTVDVNIQVPQKIIKALQTPKRIKVLVGGRGSGKSIGVASAFSCLCARGFRLCCAREFQNSLDDSVYSLVKERFEHLGLWQYINEANGKFYSSAGGSMIFKGLARNPESIKSMFGVKGLWIEEASTLSEKSIDTVLPTIRESGSEIWLTANRGSSLDPFSKSFLEPFEDALANDGGIYEDDENLVIDINYYENPWFPETLEKQRKRDEKMLPRAKYLHIWEGRYSDTVDDAIIQPEWFDACVDAHEKLGFKPSGQKRVTFDPADTGDDKAIAVVHGSVLTYCEAFSEGTVNTATDRATARAKSESADVFVFDGVGIGLGLKRDVNRSLGNTNVSIEVFLGGASPYDPNVRYEPLSSDVKNAGKNKDVFSNARAQMYWILRDKMYRTWQAVEYGTYTDPEDMFSISSGINQLNQLRSELCRIPRKPRAAKVQLMSKQEMREKGIQSPNMADCVMMGMFVAKLQVAEAPVDLGPISRMF